MGERKYTVDEIESMRRALGTLLAPVGRAYWADQLAEEVELQLRTYMQNGTEPQELLDRVNAARSMEIKAANVSASLMPTEDPAAGKVLETAQDVLEEWYETSVAHYTNATETADALYDGITGITLLRFASNYAPQGVHVSQADMEAFLDAKGIPHRHAMFKKRYDGICHIIHGNVRSGNYGT